MTQAHHTSPIPRASFTELRWNNWLLALIAALVVTVGAIILLPPEAAFWISGAMWALFAASLVVNAWGR